MRPASPDYHRHQRQAGGCLIDPDSTELQSPTDNRDTTLPYLGKDAIKEHLQCRLLQALVQRHQAQVL